MLLPDLDKILAGCMGKRVAVVGDLMLDRYL
jgi:bifunctional ADP-heptose synthase (sugar kinase/adenylyltransferase)